MTTSSTPVPTSPATDLRGRIALVTGAGSGIGAATARALAACGARVALLGRRPDPIADLADEIGGIAVPADVSDPDQLESALGLARDQLGAFDLVIANAGAMLAAPFATAERPEWRRMLDVNLMGVLDTARLTVPDLLAAAALSRPADLVFVSSIGAHIVLPEYTVYTATKAAVTQASRNLRAELGPRGVRVRAVEPGMTQSDLGHDMASADARQFLADFTEQYPPIPASAIADTIAWAVSMPSAVNVAEVVVLPTVQG